MRLVNRTQCINALNCGKDAKGKGTRKEGRTRHYKLSEC